MRQGWRRAGWIGAGLVAILALAAGLPALLPIDGARPAVAAKLSQALGRPATVAGRVRIELLPLPALIAEDVGLPARDGVAARARRATLRLDVAALLGLRIEAGAVTLDGATIELSGRPFGAFPAVPVLRLRDALITLALPDLPPLRLSGIDGELSRGGGRVAWRGGGTLAGVGFDLKGDLAAADAGGGRTLGLTLDSAAGLVTLAGRLGPDNGFSGRLDARSGLLGALIGGGTAPSLSAAVAVSGPRVTLSAMTLALPIGSLAGGGVVDLSGPPALGLKLAAARLDLDHWPGWLAMPAGGFALPAGLTVGLDLAAAELDWHGAALRDGRLDLDLAGGSLTVNEAQAALPGGGQFALFGFLAPAAAGPAFDGSLVFESPDPGQTIRWLAGHAPIAGLPAVQLQGSLHWQPGELRLDSGRLRLGRDQLDAAVSWRDGARPAIGLSLAGPQLDLDPLGPALAALPPAAAFGHDLQLGLRLGQVSLAGISAANDIAALSWTRDGLAIDNLTIGDLAGARLHFAGRLGPGAASGIAFELAADQPSRLLALAGLAPPAALARLAPLGMSGRLTAAEGGAGVQVDDLRLRAGPLLTAGSARLLLGDRPRIETSLAFPELDLDSLLAPPPARAPARSDEGPPPPAAVPRPGVTVQSLAAGDLLRPLLARLQLVAHLSATAIDWNGWHLDLPSLTLSSGGAGWTASDLAAGLLGGRLTGGGTLGGDGTLRLSLALAQASLDAVPLRILDVGIVGGRFDATAALAIPPGPVAEWPRRLAGSGRVAVGPASLRGLDLAAAGKRLAQSPKDVLLPALAAALDRGGTPIDGADATLRAADGTISCDDLAVRAASARADGKLVVDLADRRLSLAARLAFAGGGPALALRIDGPWSKPNAALDFAR